MEISIKRRINSYHTDWQGVVNFGRYSELISEATEELYKKIFGKYIPLFGNITIVTKYYQINYHKPLRFGDEIEIKVKLYKNGEHSLKEEFQIFKDKVLISDGYRILVFIDINKWEKVKIPELIENLFK